MKKKKLNSKNPKYRPVVKKEVINERRELICKVKGVEVYAVFTN